MAPESNMISYSKDGAKERKWFGERRQRLRLAKRRKRAIAKQLTLVGHNRPGKPWRPSHCFDRRYTFQIESF